MAKTVYVLHHWNELPGGIRDGKLIGYFTSEVLALDALERVRPLPGFRDVPDGFELRAMAVDEDSFPNSFPSP